MSTRFAVLFTVKSLASAESASSAGNLCGGAGVVEPSSDWVWSHDSVGSPSCTSPGMQNGAQMCAGDPTSVVLRGSGQPECISARMPDCTFNMHDLDQLDFDVDMIGCRGTWAAPLWMSPDHWAGGGSSGEIDMMENCPADEVHNNFAGGGTETKVDFADANSFRGHTTMWKQADSDGVLSIYVKTCEPSAMDASGACPEEGAAYLRNIYGLNGCSGGNCMYTMITDIWNGNSGDGGYDSCAGGRTHSSSGCSLSVTNIRMKATAGVFSGKCAALVGPAPAPAPTPTPPPPPSPTPSSSYQEYAARTCYNGHGGQEIDSDSTAPVGLDVAGCEARCDADAGCDCASFRPSDGKCWKRSACVPTQFGVDGNFDTYVKSSGYLLYQSHALLV